MAVEFDIDFETAEKVFNAMQPLDKGGEGATATEIAAAFHNSLGRKIGRTFVPSPKEDDRRMQARFERFFDVLFTVAPEDINTPLSNEELTQVFVKARDTIRDKRDKRDYATIIDMMEREDVGKAIALWRSLDTYPRGFVYLGPDEVMHRRTALALGEI